mgnify:CR=1 FL=1
MKHLLYILLIIGSLFSSEITNRTLIHINALFPNAISIQQSMYQIPKTQIKMMKFALLVATVAGKRAKFSDLGHRKLRGCPCCDPDQIFGSPDD